MYMTLDHWAPTHGTVPVPMLTSSWIWSILEWYRMETSSHVPTQVSSVTSSLKVCRPHPRLMPIELVIIITLGPTMTSSSITTMSSSITPSYTSSTPSITPTSQPSSSILQPTPTSSSITPSYTSLIIPISQPSSSILQPTPTSLPRMLCSQLENYATMYGFLDWPETPVGQTSMQDCPHGPEGGVVSRECGEGGKWEDFEGSGCDPATDTIQLLINISQASFLHILELFLTKLGLNYSTDEAFTLKH